MNRLQIFKELIGESHPEFVAESLKESYIDLCNELELIENGSSRTPIWDYDDEFEKEEINKMIEALKVVYSWYSTKELICPN